jgi:membrane-associated protein
VAAEAERVEFLALLLDFVLNLNDHLTELVANYGLWVYAIVFLIVFAETGLVVMPFLPGDSLLFAAGAVAAGGGLDMPSLCLLLMAAAILGNMVNYVIGKTSGEMLLRRYPGIVRRDHLERTYEYFQRWGGKTVVIARFLPIVRTIAPFAAGVGQMDWRRYLAFSVIGSALWVLTLVPAGYYFGNVPIVRENFYIVVIGVIVISLLPAVIGVLRLRLAAGEGSK